MSNHTSVKSHRANSSDKMHIFAAFNGPTSSVFQSLSPEPVASASLGQVYRGRLRPELGGDEVAVKVQRPAMLESIALDLYLMRSFAVFAQRFPNVSQFPPSSALATLVHEQDDVLLLQVKERPRTSSQTSTCRDMYCIHGSRCNAW